MSIEKKEQEELIEQIMEIELDMFLSVRASEPSACQEHPQAFKMMRWMTYSVLPEKILLSYLGDLEQARESGRNLMTEKYARMENKIPRIKDSPLIREITNIEATWAKELAQKYPLTFQGGSPGFKNYLACELETYSDRTLELYYKLVTEAEREDSNLVEKRYNNLFKRLGYDSIEGREKAARAGD